MLGEYRLEVAFSPALFGGCDLNNAIVVVIDVLRATSAICTALESGVKKVLPVSTVEEAL